MGMPLPRAPSDGAMLLRNELPVSGRGSRNTSPGTRGISLESLSWESKHVPMAQRPYEMWDGQLQQLQTQTQTHTHKHTPTPPSPWASTRVQAGSCCHCLQQQGLGEELWAKKSLKKTAQREMELFCTTDEELDLLSLPASSSAAPEFSSISVSQESLGNW